MPQSKETAEKQCGKGSGKGYKTISESLETTVDHSERH